MKLPKSAAAVLLSLSSAFAAHAATPDDSKVLVRVSYLACLPQNEIAPMLKNDFNQDKVEIAGKYLGQNATLYANAEADSYAIIVDVPTAELVGMEQNGETSACVLELQPTGYSTAAETSSSYRSIFVPK